MAVIYSAVQTASLMKASAGNDRMQEIAAAIQEGAQAYLRRQYLTIGMVGVVILVIVGVLIGPLAAGGFVIGSVLSGAAGFAGMLVSVRANVRTAQGASESLERGLSLAFKAPKDGTYLVAVNSASADAFGPFKLKSSQVTPYDGKPLGAGSEAIDWLVDEKQDYTLKVDKAGIYAVTMESGALDAYLRLSGRGVDIEDDDGGGNLNARIRAYLEPGEYTLAASSLSTVRRAICVM